MARKRVGSTKDVVEPAPEGSRVLVYRREPEASDLYEVGSWRGVPHFRCRCCAFDTLVAGNMLAHLESHAGSEPALGDASADLSMTNVTGDASAASA